LEQNKTSFHTYDNFNTTNLRDFNRKLIEQTIRMTKGQEN